MGGMREPVPEYYPGPTVTMRKFATRAIELTDQRADWVSNEDTATAMNSAGWMAIRARNGQYRVWSSRRTHLRDMLAEKNIWGIHAIIKRFPHSDHDELFSDAMVSYLRGIEKYNPFRGFRFSTYVYTGVFRAMARAIANRNRHAKRFKMENWQTEVVPCSPEEPEDENAPHMAEVIERHIACLEPVERRVIRLRFPLDNTQRLTLIAVGEGLKLSKERVRQIQAAALRKLRLTMEDDDLIMGCVDTVP